MFFLTSHEPLPWEFGHLSQVFPQCVKKIRENIIAVVNLELKTDLNALLNLPQAPSAAASGSNYGECVLTIKIGV
jgi:hypothetical protein